MKKIKVNEEACIACGACVAIDNEHFAFNDKGLSTAINQDNLDSPTVISAMEACPTGAIVYEEACDCVNGGVCTCEECDCEKCNCDEECDCGEECSCNECHGCEE